MSCPPNWVAFTNNYFCFTSIFYFMFCNFDIAFSYHILSYFFYPFNSLRKHDCLERKIIASLVALVNFLSLYRLPVAESIWIWTCSDYFNKYISPSLERMEQKWEMVGKLEPNLRILVILSIKPPALDLIIYSPFESIPVARLR